MYARPLLNFGEQFLKGGERNCVANLRSFSLSQINTAKGILDTILSVQPKESGAGGKAGETREAVVFRIADDMLRKLPR